ncbi:hypothetical protein J5226_09135 [Lysobacter sp. K5869]|uniref:hypothetical protein n=1 Tax=Lysobacter sp. K5869 TaxID=2820808 RepID=UPI001C062E81|nr:hypothetical protein [Lysobacter sp. K5869]QWP78534.1 hypothetical protein J5226_09135 [Lysobacter sp. K5869]
MRAGLAAALSLAAFAAAAAPPDDPELARLSQRLTVLEASPDTAQVATFERYRARQAIDAAVQARSRDRAEAVRIADRRVETAEIVVRTQLAQRELDRLDRERSELLVEASRRDADRARAEAERLRVQAQIQAEEAERLRQAADQEAAARQQAEGLLDDVAGKQAAKLRAARERDAELARKEAELLGVDPPPATPPKPKPKKK